MNDRKNQILGRYLGICLFFCAKKYKNLSYWKMLDKVLTFVLMRSIVDTQKNIVIIKIL